MPTRRQFLAVMSATALPRSSWAEQGQMTVLRYRIRDAGAAPGVQGPSGWISFMPRDEAPDRTTRFTLPGNLDPFHLDMVGPLRLLSHLPLAAPGSPGILDMRGGKVRLHARLSSGFDPRGAALRLVLCRRFYGASILHSVQASNWMLNSYDFLNDLGTDYRTAESVVSDSAADWTDAGVNATGFSEIITSRYIPGGPVGNTLSNVSATVHLAFIGGRVDQPPIGTVDIDWIEIESSNTPVPPIELAAADAMAATDPMGAHRAYGALARAGDATAMYYYGRALARGSVGSTVIPKDTVTAAEMLSSISRSNPLAALEYARLLASGDGVERDPAAARALLASHPNSPACRAVLANMKLYGVGGAVDQVGAFNDFLWSAEHSETGIPQPAAMASTGRSYLIARGVDGVNYAQAYVWLSRSIKFSKDYMLQREIDAVIANRSTAIANLPYAGAASELESSHVANWSPTPV